MPVRWKLQSVLRQHQISAYRLWKESGLSMATAYRLARGDSKYVNAETLDRVLGALERLTGSAIQVGDLVQYERAVAYIVHDEPDVATALERMVKAALRGEKEAITTAPDRVSALVDAWILTGLAFSTERTAIDHAGAVARTGTTHVLAVARGDIEDALAHLDTGHGARDSSGGRDG